MIKHNVQLPSSSPYTSKDQLKANVCDKFIGRGSPRSSTAKYAEAFGILANSGSYMNREVVFVSVEGNRKGRLALDISEISLAVKAGCTFIADKAYDRERSYNIGERELAILLTSLNFKSKELSNFTLWTK